MYPFKEVILASQLNTSRHEYHQWSLRQVETRIVEPREVSEEVELDNRLDLFVILDKSGSMVSENRNFLYPHAREMLDAMGAGRSEDIDLRVLFLGAGVDGIQARPSFRSRLIRDDIRAHTVEDEDGNVELAYPRIREALIAYQDDVSTQDELDAKLSGLLDSDPLWEEWDEVLMPSTPFGSPEFIERYPDPELVDEWFELFVRNPFAGGRGDQGWLMANIPKYLQLSPHENFPRKDSSIAVLMITDDQEDGAVDLRQPSEDLIFWEDYAIGRCDGETVDERQRCRNSIYVNEYIRHIRDVSGNPNWRFFGMTCSEQYSPENFNCAITQQAIDQGSRFRSGYDLLAERTDGLHRTLPGAPLVEDVGGAFQQNLDDFAEKILRTSERRVNLSGSAWRQSVRVFHGGEELPRYEPGATQGFECVEDAVGDICTQIRLVGYSVEDLPLKTTLTIEYIPYALADAPDELRVELRHTPIEDSISVVVGTKPLPLDAFSYAASNNEVIIPSPPVGEIKVFYDQPDDAPSALVLLEALARPAPVMVIHNDALMPECPEDVEDEDKKGCFDFRDWRAVEIWRDEIDGALSPTEGDIIEVVYAETMRFYGERRAASETFRLARSPQSADKISVWKASTVPPSLDLFSEEERVRADRYKGFEPLSSEQYSYDPVRNEITLSEKPLLEQSLLITYAPELERAFHPITQSDPGEAASGLRRSLLSPQHLTNFEQLRVYTESCQGANIAPFEEESTMEVIDRTFSDYIQGYQVGEVVRTPDGDAVPVTGIADYPDFLLDAQMVNTCGEEEALTSIVLLSHSLLFASENDYPTAFCHAMAATQRCATSAHWHQLGFLVNEMARHGEALFATVDAARRRALADLGRQTFTMLLDRNPRDFGALVNIAFSHWQLSTMAEDEPEREQHLFAAYYFLIEAANRSQDGAYFDILANYLDFLFQDPAFAKEASRRAAALAPDALSSRRADFTGNFAALTGPSAGPTNSQVSSGCDGDEESEESESDPCEKLRCELPIVFYIGVAPVVTIGRNVRNATAYAVCELTRGGCYEACQRGGGVGGGCGSAPVGNPGLDLADDILSNLAGGGLFDGGFGVDVTNGQTVFEGSYGFRGSRTASPGVGFKAQGPRLGDLGKPGSFGQFSVSEASVDLSAGTGGGSNVGVTLGYDRDSGQYTFSASAGQDTAGDGAGGFGHNLMLFQLNSPGKDGSGGCD